MCVENRVLLKSMHNSWIFCAKWAQTNFYLHSYFAIIVEKGSFGAHFITDYEICGKSLCIIFFSSHWSTLFKDRLCMIFAHLWILHNSTFWGTPQADMNTSSEWILNIFLHPVNCLRQLKWPETHVPLHWTTPLYSSRWSLFLSFPDTRSTTVSHTLLL